MFFPESRVRVYLYGQAVDMRKSFDALYAVARAAFSPDPTGGDLYVFVVSVPRTPSSRPTLNLPTSCPLQRRRWRSGHGSATTGGMLGAGGGLSGVGLEGHGMGGGQRG